MLLGVNKEVAWFYQPTPTSSHPRRKIGVWHMLWA